MIGLRSNTPGYFRVLGIRILSGRDFNEAERAGNNSSVIVSESLARKLFPNENAIGQRLGLSGVGSPWLTVIGFVADGCTMARNESAPTRLFSARICNRLN